MSTTVPEYPNAVWIPAHPSNYASARSRNIDCIVIHITSGDARFPEQTAAFFARQRTRSSSAHYIVGRAGDVVQCVRNRDVAFHAHRVSRRSIGIEHVVSVARNEYPTPAQYRASAELVAWLGHTLQIDVTDPAKVQGHSDIDSQTTHACPTSRWNWKEYRRQLGVEVNFLYYHSSDTVR